MAHNTSILAPQSEHEIYERVIIFSFKASVKIYMIYSTEYTATSNTLFILISTQPAQNFHVNNTASNDLSFSNNQLRPFPYKFYTI